jgi:hypothetical protein
MPGVWETDAEWRRLKHELQAWREHRVRADTLGQHRSQLGAAGTLIDRALDELRVPFSTLTGTGPTIAEACRIHDRRLAWLRRLWNFFRERFDQRDDPTLAPLLRGADEVVWSCHREPMSALDSPGGPPTTPPPLPYVEPETTPEVFPHGLVPGALRRDVDAPFLRRTLEELPFAVVRVPATCVTAPWWLVHLGHEVGHVIDGQLLGYRARAALVDGIGLDAAAAADWTQWSAETFADLYAVLMHGQWAVWALSSADMHDDVGMTTRRDSYPPPAVRLLVMAHACRALGAATDDLERDETRCQNLVTRDPVLAAMAADGRRVVQALMDHEVRRAMWPTLTAWAPANWDRKALAAWVTTLGKRPSSPPARPRRAWARSLVAASVLERKHADDRSDFDGTGLAASLLTWLPEVREGGSRATQDVVTARVAAQGVSLARALMEAEPLP